MKLFHEKWLKIHNSRPGTLLLYEADGEITETSVTARYEPVSPTDYYTVITETEAEPVITTAEVETQCAY